MTTITEIDIEPAYAAQRLLRLLPGTRRRPFDQARIVAQLRQALRRERERGLAQHWSYDLGRHRALLMAWRHEARKLAAERSARRR